MSTKDPVAQACKFLEQLRVVQRENAALWEEIMDPESRVLQDEYRRLMTEMAQVVRDVKMARSEVGVMRRKLEAAGVDPETAPMSATKSQRKDAILQAAALIRKGRADEALRTLERRSS